MQKLAIFLKMNDFVKYVALADNYACHRMWGSWDGGGREG